MDLVVIPLKNLYYYKLFLIISLKSTVLLYLFIIDFSFSINFLFLMNCRPRFYSKDEHSTIILKNLFIGAYLYIYISKNNLTCNNFCVYINE